ncbi:MAG: hypothetical protein NT178_03960 [Proteobacteria bacterium]|nr:hypothetical protein [Pseudomonadota bacterium]
MHPSILRNTLISEASIKKILSLPGETGTYLSLSEILAKFENIKKFASEIHTEIRLIKPILKVFGYAYESKPKFYEDNIKGPDVALFTAEENRVATSPLWGTKEYYDNALGILLLKRYGRTLNKGISGFYLEFENKIPIYQLIYLLKKIKTPWGILTNGRNWILIKKSVNFEIKLIEIDIEKPSSEGNDEILHLFYHMFSLNGLNNTIPDLIKEERDKQIELLKENKAFARNSLLGIKKKTEIYPKIAHFSKAFFPDQALLSTETHLDERHIEAATIENKISEKPDIINEYDTPDIFSYLFVKNEYHAGFNVEGIFLSNNQKYTKEDVLSFKILDMTPGFGAVTTRVLEELAYLSFVLPYKEKNTFVTEWEDEYTLKNYILNNVMYGIERSHISLDIFQNLIKNRFDTPARHYKSGNPLIGISIKDLPDFSDLKNQMNLFNRNPGEIIQDFRDTYKLYFNLSDKIKEDVEVKKEIEIKLNIYRERIRDTLDVITSTYFSRLIENRNVQDLLFGLDSSESTWDNFRKKNWFIESKDIAKKNGFFHFEIEFPFLLQSAFDFIYVQPSFNYIWEDESPLIEITKAYIKSGMRYLKPEGKLIICAENVEKDLLVELQKSKKYNIESKAGSIVISRGNP